MATNTEKIVVQVVVQGDKQLGNLEKKTKNTTASFGKMTAGIIGASAAFQQMSKLISGAIRTFKSFEFEMAKVKAITGSTEKDFKKLTNTAQQLGRTTFFTASQVAELQVAYGKLGFSTTEILAAQEATLQLATATQSDLGRAAVVAGAAVRGFGLDASETQRVVDVMAVSFTSSALDIEKFQTSMTKVAPIASAAGISIESTSAVMGTLTDAGIEASIAGTSLRNIFLKMQDPASDLSKHLGFTVKSTDDLEKALTQLNSEGLSNADMMQLVDLRQVAAFQTMVGGADNILSLTTALENADGAGREMADMVGDTMEGAFLRLTSATEGLMIAIVDGFIGQALTKILNVGADVLNFFTDFTKGIESVNNEIANSATVYKAQAVQLEQMANRFDILSSSTNRTAEEEEELQRILVTLQGEFGRAVISIDKKTDALTLNRNALDQVIARTVLLADTEALKLVHKLRNVQKEIALEKEKKKEIDGTIDSITSSTAAMAENNSSLAAQSDQTSVNIQVFDEFGNALETSTTNQDKLQESQLESLALGTQILALQNDELEITNLLTEAGYSQKEVEDLLNQSTEKSTGLITGNTDTIIANTKAKKINNDVDREMLDFRVTQMMMGYLKEEEIAQLQKDLKIKEIQDLRNLLKVQGDVGINRMAIAQRIFDLEKELNTQSQAEKDKAFAEDIKRAALSGESAEDAAKRLIRSKIMEAVSLYIVGAFSANPLLGAIVAAGAGSLVSSVFENAFSNITFANGGMIEEFANGGMVHGKSHAQGGEKFAVGGRVVELEGGEAVINKRSTSMFRNQLSAMNSAGGGVKFADGGLLNMPSFSQQQFNALGQNQMMGAMGGASKVVVVEADITSTQNSVSVIESDAII